MSETHEIANDQEKAVSQLMDNVEYLKSLSLALVNINKMYSDLIEKLNDNGLTEDQAEIMQPAIDAIAHEYKKLKAGTPS